MIGKIVASDSGMPLVLSNITVGLARNKSITLLSKKLIFLGTHSGEKPYVCTWKGCDKAYAYRDSLKDHINSHTGLKPYFCQWPECMLLKCHIS